MKIDKIKRQEWETNLNLANGDVLCIWIGHMQGDYYGNLSLKHNGILIEKGKDFHVRKEWFDWVLDLPFSWKQIIDAKICYENNTSTDFNEIVKRPGIEDLE